MKFDYDLFVIGAGSGGLAASKRAAKYGAKVAIAEHDLVGGTCVIRGCVPKKLMVYASHFSHLCDDAGGYGWKKPSSLEFDWEYFREILHKEVMRLSHLHTRFLDQAGVELIRGQAVFVDEHTLNVDGRKITADKILIAVGGEASKPQISGIEHAITSREIFHLPQLPQHIVIVGAGYIGTEFAGVMNGLGSQVTLVTRRQRILTGFDNDIGKGVQFGMENHGIKILYNTDVEKIQAQNQTLTVKLTGDYQDSLPADAVLYATGRLPNVKGLQLNQAGVEVVRGQGQGTTLVGAYTVDCPIAVDEYSRTTQPNIFAVGDCTNRRNLTPIAIAEGRAFADTEFGNQSRVMSYHCIPSAVFSQPEAATVGLMESEALEQYGDDVQCYCTQFRPLYHSLTGREEKAFLKLVTQKSSDRVLGAHMVGESAAEIIQGLAVAIRMGATKKDFDATIGIHPSVGEEWLTLK